MRVLARPSQCHLRAPQNKQVGRHRTVKPKTGQNKASDEIQSLLARAVTRSREMADDLDALQRMLGSVRDDQPLSLIEAEMPCLETLATVNGRRFSDQEFHDFNEDDFDVILDLTDHSLRYRPNPSQHGSLSLSPLKDLGPERMRVLTFMVAHPTRRICSETMPALAGEPDYEMEPGALAQTIRLLRRALGTSGKQNPYILTEPAWGESRRRGASVYLLNPEWQYLLIDWKSQGNHSSVSAPS